MVTPQVTHLPFFTRSEWLIVLHRTLVDSEGCLTAEILAAELVQFASYWHSTENLHRRAQHRHQDVVDSLTMAVRAAGHSPLCGAVAANSRVMSTLSLTLLFSVSRHSGTAAEFIVSDDDDDDDNDDDDDTKVAHHSSTE